MGARFGKLRAKLRYSFWFLPAIISLAAALLSLFLGWIDDRLDSPVLEAFIPLDVEGMRDMLGMVASSMITVATTAFSIIIVALQLASGQLGPRLLRNFIRDRSNQIAFGVFLGTFVYCLLLMRFLGNGTPTDDLPIIGFVGAIVLTLAGVAVLVYFIHHAALSIQKDRVIARVSGELMESLDLLYPKTIGHEPPIIEREGHASQRFPAHALSAWDDAATIELNGSGYIQAVDSKKLTRITQREDLCVYLLKRPGDFVNRGAVVARVRPRNVVTPAVHRRLSEVFILGNERTQQQDVAFVFDQLVEIAIRALSPGINDSFTAMRCIDRLTDALAVVARTAFPSPYRFDSYGRLRVVTNPVNFHVLVTMVLYPIAESAAGHTEVIARLFRSVEEVARSCREKHQLSLLVELNEYLKDLAGQAPAAEHRLPEIEAWYGRVREALQAAR
jgi:uncharacterized membrane protein